MKQQDSEPISGKRLIEIGFKEQNGLIYIYEFETAKIEIELRDNQNSLWNLRFQNKDSIFQLPMPFNNMQSIKKIIEGMTKNIVN